MNPRQVFVTGGTGYMGSRLIPRLLERGHGIAALAERIPSKREAARRLGLVTIAQMVNALIHAVENPAKGVEVVEVPKVRTAGWVAGRRRSGYCHPRS